ncbi:MAG: TolC family protein [Deltaproteobacteria bacterium]|nr:TolC family protein [Deltaproteobacteria bacterium]
MVSVLPSARALLAGAAVTLAAAPAAAQSQDLTWADVLRLVDDHPRLREAEARTAASQAGITAASAIPNPSLDVALGYGVPQEGPGGGRFEQAYELSVPLDWLAQRGPRVDAARATLDESKAEARALRRDALLQLGVLFWNVAFDQARVASLEALEAQAAEVAKLVRLRVEKGEARPIEVPRVETELERVRNELAAARSLQQSHRAQLQLWIKGLDQKDWRVASAALEVLPKVPELETALAAVRESHPLLDASRARARVLDAEIIAEKRQRIPSFSVKGFYVNELDRQSVGAGLGVSLPVFNWNTGRIDQAEAARRAETFRLEAQARDLEASAAEARASCAQGQQAGARYHDQILPRAEKAASMLERSFQIGESTLLEVLDARRVLGETQREYLSSLLQTQLDCNRLQLLLGETR